MNYFPESPFFFYMDEPRVTLSDDYIDIKENSNKIIELIDVGCDANKEYAFEKRQGKENYKKYINKKSPETPELRVNEKFNNQSDDFINNSYNKYKGSNYQKNPKTERKQWIKEDSSNIYKNKQKSPKTNEKNKIHPSTCSTSFAPHYKNDVRINARAKFKSVEEVFSRENDSKRYINRAIDRDSLSDISLKFDCETPGKVLKSTKQSANSKENNKRSLSSQSRKNIGKPIKSTVTRNKPILDVPSNLKVKYEGRKRVKINNVQDDNGARKRARNPSEFKVSGYKSNDESKVFSVHKINESFTVIPKRSKNHEQNCHGLNVTEQPYSKPRLQFHERDREKSLTLRNQRVVDADEKVTDHRSSRYELHSNDSMREIARNNSIAAQQRTEKREQTPKRNTAMTRLPIRVGKRFRTKSPLLAIRNEKRAKFDVSSRDEVESTRTSGDKSRETVRTVKLADEATSTENLNISEDCIEPNTNDPGHREHGKAGREARFNFWEQNMREADFNSESITAKVFNMANAVREQRKKEFAMYNSHLECEDNCEESSRDILDIGMAIMDDILANEEYSLPIYYEDVSPEEYYGDRKTSRWTFPCGIFTRAKSVRDMFVW